MTNKYDEEIVSPGDKASRLAHEVCMESFDNSPAVDVIPLQPGNFRGPVGYVWKRHILEQMIVTSDQIPHWEMMECQENDGAGGKPQFFSLVGTPEVFAGLGWEIITMVADDFARSGRLPVVIDNEINAKRITEANWPLFEEMMRGYGRALSNAALVNITGEVAVMKHSVTAFCDQDRNDQLVLNWGASCIGLAHRELLIDGSGIKPGQVVVGFSEPGYRCNGGTFFTELLLEHCGHDVRTLFDDTEVMDFVRQLTVPSQSYAFAVCDILGWELDGNIRQEGDHRTPVHGIAHITGGGLRKFVEILPDGVGAVLDSLPEPAPALRQAQEMSWDIGYLRLTDEQAYTTLHGGCGMLLVVDEVDVPRTLSVAYDMDITAQVVGQITESAKNEVVIHSRFKEGKVFCCS